MSTSHSGLPSISVQKSAVNAALNSTLMFMYLFGIYTGVYIATIHIYLYKRGATAVHRTSIIGILTALYLVLTAQTCTQWYLTNLAFCIHGATIFQIFLGTLSSNNIPPVFGILGNIFLDTGFLLADGFLVWRCIHACGHSAFRYVVPLGFFIIEFVIAVIETSFTGLLSYKKGFLEKPKNVRDDNLIGAALFGAVAATSTTATFIICHHIYKSTTYDSRSRRRYKHIVDALIQSSLPYSVIAFVATICGFFNKGDIVKSATTVVIAEYVQALCAIVSGLAPTLMVARLAIATNNEPVGESTAVLPSELNHPCTEYDVDIDAMVKPC